MSATIDERVVEMKFDNTNFEANVKTTMSTLDKLKQALKFDNAKESMKTLNTAVREVNFDHINAAAEKTNSYFSILGRTIDNFRDKIAGQLTNTITKIFTAIPNQISSGGWARALNVEQAKFTLNGLGIAWEEVSEDIDHAVQDTAYGADAAAKAASQLAASGVNFRNATRDASGNIEVYSDMGRALRGISGVAAMTNRSYEEISRIFIKAAGSGRVMNNELDMLGERGLNARKTLGDALGITEQEVRELASKGQIDFQTFADAMDEAFGDHATAANDTFDGSIANMKASLSRIGQDFAQTIQQQTPQVFNSIKGLFNKIRKFTKPFADEVFTPAFTDAMKVASATIQKITEKIPSLNAGFGAIRKNQFLSGLRGFLNGITNIIYGIILALTEVKNAFLDVFGGTDIFQKIQDAGIAFQRFSEYFNMTGTKADFVRNVFKALFSVLKLGLTIIGNILKLVAPLANILFAVGSALGQITAALFGFVNSLLGADNELSNSVNLFDMLCNGITFVSNVLSYLIVKFGEFASAVINSKFYAFAEMIKSIAMAFKDFVIRIELGKKALIALGVVLGAPIAIIAALVYGIYTLVTSIMQLDVAQTVIVKVTTAFEFLRTTIISVIANITNDFNGFVNKIKNFKISDIFNPLLDKIKGFKNTISGFINKYPALLSIVNKIKGAIDSLVKTFTTLRTVTASAGANGPVEQFNSSVVKTNKNVSSLTDVIRKVIEKIKEFTAGITAGKLIVVAYAASMIMMFSTVTKVAKTFMSIGNSFKGVANSISQVGRSLSSTIDSYKKEKPSKIMEIAKAIFIMAAAVAVVASLDSDSLKRAVIAIAALAGIMIVLGAAMTIFTNSIAKTRGKDNIVNQDFLNMLLAFVSLAGTLALVAASLKIIESIKFSTEMIKTSLLILGIMGVMVLLSGVLSKFTQGKNIKAVFSMLAFAIALSSLGKAMVKLSEVDWEVITTHAKEIIAVMAAMSLIAMAASKVGVFKAAGFLLLVMVLDKVAPKFVNIVNSLGEFATVITSWFTRIMAALNEYRTLMLEIGVLIATMVLVAGVSGKGFKSFGTGMFLLAASFVVLAKGIIALSAIDAGTVTRGVGVIKKVFTLFTVLALILSIGKGGQNALKISAAIGVMVLSLYLIAGAVWVLGTLDKTKVEQGMECIKSILLCFALIMGAASLGNGKSKTGVVIGVVLAIITLLSTLIVLTVVPYEDLKMATMMIVAVMGSLVLVMLAFAKIIKQASKTPKNGGNNVAALLLSILSLITIAGALVGAVYVFNKINASWQTIITTAIGISLIIDPIAKATKRIASIKANTLTKNKALNFVRASESLFLIAASLSLVVATAKATGASWSDMVVAAVAIDLVLGKLAKVVKTVSKSSNFNKSKANNLIQASKTILIIATSLSLLVASTKLSGGGAEDILAAMIAIDLVVVALIGLIKTMSSENTSFSKSKANQLILASASVAIIAGSLAVLTTLNNLTGGGASVMLSAMTALSLTILALAGVIKIVSGVKGLKMDKMMMLVVAASALAIVAGSLSVLTSLTSITGGGSSEMLSAMMAISLTILALAGVMKIIASIKGLKMDKIMMLVVASSSIAIIAGSLAILATQDYDSILAAMTSVTLVIGALMGAIAVMTLIKPDWINIVKDFAMIVAVLLPVVAALVVLNMFDTNGTMLQNAIGLSAVLIAISAALGVLTIIGLAGPAAFIGIAALVTLIASIVAEFVIMGALLGSIKDKYGPTILSGLDFLVQIGARIGKAIGEFVGNIAESISNHLPDIGKNLSLFAAYVMPFMTVMKRVDNKVVDGTKNICSALTYIGGAGVISALTSFMSFGTGMKTIKSNLEAFGSAISAYLKTLGTVDGANIEKVASASKMIAEMMVILTGESVLTKVTTWFCGKNQFESMGANLESFAKGIKNFADVTDDINGEKFAVGVQVTDQLISLLHKLPNDGGLLGNILGNNGLQYFNEETIGGFAKGIRAFSENSKNLDVDAANTAIAIADSIFQLEPPNQGGALGDFLGNNNFEFFNQQTLGQFALGLKMFSFNAKGADETAADVAVNIAAKLFALEPPNEGGFISTILGDNTYAQLGEELGPFGYAIKAFAEQVSGIKQAHIDGATYACELARVLFESNMHAQLNSVLMNDVWTRAIQEGRIEGMNIVLTDLATNMKTFLDSFAGVSNERIQAAIGCVNSVMEMVEQLSNFKSTSLNGFRKAMERAGDLGINAFLEQFQNASTDGTTRNIAQIFLSSVADGFTSSESIMKTAVIVVCGQISQEFYQHDATFKNAGSHLMFIVKTGIDASSVIVQSAAEAVINAAANAAINKAKDRAKDLRKAGQDMFDTPGGVVPEDEVSYAGGISSARKAVVSTAESVVNAGGQATVSKSKDWMATMFASGKSVIGSFFSGMQSGYQSGGIAGAYKAFKEQASKSKISGASFYDSIFKAGGGEGVTNLTQLQERLNISGIFEEGSEAADTFKDALEGVTEGFDDVGGAAGGAGSSIKNFASTIADALNSTSGMSFFNKLELKAETSAQTILDNMKSNVNGMVQWSTRLAELMERGLNKEMIQTMAEAGLDSYDQINAFMSMTDEQIMEANNLFLQAEQVRATAASDLGAGWAKIGGGTMEGFADGVKRNLGLATGEIKNAMDATIEEGNKDLQINSPSKVFAEMGDFAMLGLQLGLWRTAILKVYPECQKIAETVIQTLKEKMGDEKDGSPSFMIGTNFTIGLARGIKAASKEVEAAASEVAEIPEKASKKTTKEASPSKVAIEIGKFFDLGLAKGIRDNAKEVETASKDLSNTPLDIIRSSMDDMQSYMATNINLNPVIRPSLDISGISSEASNLARMFNEQHEYKLNAMQNDWSNPDVRNSFLDTFANRIGSEYADRVVDAIESKDMNANVTLEGEAGGIFKVVRQQNRAFIRRTGYSGI